MTFRFRKFSVEDDCSTMRIGTDAILLGAWTNPGKTDRILEIGTGCGVIALMMAQKSNAHVDAIDINPESVDQARMNFNHSPWKDRLTAINRSFQEHAKSSGILYDIIVTNPPFFRNSLKSPDIKRNLARHHGTFSFIELFKAANILLSDTGSFWLIVPVSASEAIRGQAQICKLVVHQILNVKPKENKKVNRVLMKFCRSNPEQEIVEELILRHEDNSFTRQYKELTADFYLSLP